MEHFAIAKNQCIFWIRYYDHRRRNQGDTKGTCLPKFSVCSIYALYYKVIYYILCPSQSKSFSYATEIQRIASSQSQSNPTTTPHIIVTATKLCSKDFNCQIFSTLYDLCFCSLCNDTCQFHPVTQSVRNWLSHQNNLPKIVEPYILCVTEFLTFQSMDDVMLVNKLCSTARAFPRCTGICIQKPKWNTASFIVKPKNYHTIYQGKMNYVSTLCDWVSQFLYSLWRTDLNLLYYYYYYYSWVWLGTCFPRSYQNQVPWS